MLDVHPPHEAAHTRKDFFIHIATIVIGLLIAVCLEQSVEWIHHRDELRETRHALVLERQLNASASIARTKEFRRVTGKLQTDLAVFEYLKTHPGAPPEQWPGKLSWNNLYISFDDPAWQVAVKNNVTAYMAHAELEEWTEIYRRADSSNDTGDAFIRKARQAGSFGILQPDASRLTPEQIDDEIRLISEALFLHYTDGTVLTNLARRYPDFSAPSSQDLRSITRGQSPPEDVKEVDEIQNERRRAAKEIEEANGR